MNLEPGHNWAIREEIGERLRALLSREEPGLFPRLRELLDLFDEADHSSVAPRAPSIVPRMRSAQPPND
jgi:hypothetical protein